MYTYCYLYIIIEIVLILLDFTPFPNKKPKTKNQKTKLVYRRFLQYVANARGSWFLVKDVTTQRTHPWPNLSIALGK